jgi:hypothetical protein
MDQPLTSEQIKELLKLDHERQEKSKGMGTAITGLVGVGSGAATHYILRDQNAFLRHSPKALMAGGLVATGMGLGRVKRIKDKEKAREGRAVAMSARDELETITFAIKIPSMLRKPIPKPKPPETPELLPGMFVPAGYKGSDSYNELLRIQRRPPIGMSAADELDQIISLKSGGDYPRHWSQKKKGKLKKKCSDCGKTNCGGACEHEMSARDELNLIQLGLRQDINTYKALTLKPAGRMGPLKLVNDMTTKSTLAAKKGMKLEDFFEKARKSRALFNMSAREELSDIVELGAANRALAVFRGKFPGGISGPKKWVDSFDTAAYGWKPNPFQGGPEKQQGLRDFIAKTVKKIRTPSVAMSAREQLDTILFGYLGAEEIRAAAEAKAAGLKAAATAKVQARAAGTGLSPGNVDELRTGKTAATDAVSASKKIRLNRGAKLGLGIAGTSLLGAGIYGAMRRPQTQQMSAKEELNTILFGTDPRPRDQQGQFTDANGNMIDPNSIAVAYQKPMQTQPQQQAEPEEEQSAVKKLMAKLKR